MHTEAADAARRAWHDAERAYREEFDRLFGAAFTPDQTLTRAGAPSDQTETLDRESLARIAALRKVAAQRQEAYTASL